MGERPSTPSLGNIMTRIYESLNAFEQVRSGRDPLNCCKMPTMPPNMASPTTKKGLFQLSCLLDELTQINQIANLLVITQVNQIATSVFTVGYH